MEETEIEIEWQGDYIEFTVEYRYSPPHRGARDSFGGKAGMGPQLEPDEPEYFEVQAVYHKGKECKHLKDDVIELIDIELQDVGQQMIQDAEADRAEARYEAKMEAMEARYNDLY